MASPKLVARLVSLLALSSLGVGCYSTTPHRAQVASAAAPKECSAAIVDVFTRSGFIQLPTPLNLSMLFGPRIAGQYTSFMRTGAGVGVTIAPLAPGGECHVTLEALSPDVTCPAAFGNLSCDGTSGSVAMNAVNGDTYPMAASRMGTSSGPCPMSAPLMCDLSYAPGEDNDAAVDELARRLRVALSPAARLD
ncbi:MAG TPA: hypothetical protein VH560_05510 [Polyangia bacterium]|nr:hypothetical protein [Polyangia bacterium]